MKPPSKVYRYFDLLLDIGLWISMILVALIAVFMFVDVLFRYLFSKSIGPIVDLTTLFLVYIPFLGGGWLLKENGHVNINLIIMRLRERDKSLLAVITSIIGIAVGLILLWYGISVTYNYWDRDVRTIEVLATPLWIYTLALPIGGLPIALQFARRAFGNWETFRNNIGKSLNSIHDF